MPGILLDTLLFPALIFFLLKHFPPPDIGKGNIFLSRNKLPLIASPCECTLGSLCSCKNVPLIDVHYGRNRVVCCSALQPRSIGVTLFWKQTAATGPHILSLWDPGWCCEWIQRYNTRKCTTEKVLIIIWTVCTRLALNTTSCRSLLTEVMQSFALGSPSCWIINIALNYTLLPFEGTDLSRSSWPHDSISLM